MRNPLQATKAWQAWHGRHGPNPSKSGRGWGVATVRPWLPGSKQGRNEICAARQKNFRQKAKKREKGKEKRIKGTLPGRNETRRRRTCCQVRPRRGRRRAGPWESPKPPRATPARLRFRSLSDYDKAILRSSRTSLPPTPIHSLPCRRSLPVSLLSDTIPPELDGPLPLRKNNWPASHPAPHSPRDTFCRSYPVPRAPIPPPWAAPLLSKHSTRPPHTSSR